MSEAREMPVSLHFGAEKPWSHLARSASVRAAFGSLAPGWATDGGES
jgi:hypothetical protein